MKYLHPTSLIAILFCSFNLLSAQKSVYTFPFENEYRLPPMHAQLNLKEISTTYQTYGNIYTTEITGMGNDTVKQTSYSFISDTRVMDAVRFLEFYMEEQLLDPGNQKIAVHRGVGRGKKSVSIYTMTNRKSHQRAMLDALEKLNTEVMSDPRLNQHMALEAELSKK